MTTVVVAGATGTVGGRLLRRLAADPDVDRVVAVGRTGPAQLPPGVEFVRADLRDAVLGRLLHGADAVVNVEFADDLTHDDRVRLVVRVQGTRRLLEAVRIAGVPAMVHVSPALVYGADEGNEVPLSESQPLRTDPRFIAVHHAVLADEAVRAFAGDHPACRVVVLRAVPAVVSDVDSAVTRHLESPLLPQVHGFDPPVQFIDVDDLVEAVRLVALDQRARGIYNVAADGWLTSSDVRRILARPAVRLPQEVAVSAATALYRLHLLAVPPQALRYLMHPWVVDTTRLRALGWTPSASQRDILHRFVTEHRRWLSVGRLRVRTTRLVAALGAAWVLIASATAWLAARWWRTRRAV
ncbi:MAG: NAD-dependent epimerase/dehydratase family protein [Actinobacteria bacterium]|nr:NAD-dependent epimerase/dehydratase family protein [Actinomycetota bacterium]